MIHARVSLFHLMLHAHRSRTHLDRFSLAPTLRLIGLTVPQAACLSAAAKEVAADALHWFVWAPQRRDGNRRRRAKCAPQAQSRALRCKPGPNGPIGPAAQVHHGRRRQWLCLNVPPPSPLRPSAPFLPHSLTQASAHWADGCSLRQKGCGTAALHWRAQADQPSRADRVSSAVGL